jgi:hypothetical protein
VTRLIEISGDFLAPSGVAGEDAVAAEIARVGFDMK